MCTSGRFSTSINQSLIFLLLYLVSLTIVIISSSNGRGTCYGDSGGPAIVKQPDGSYVQVQPLRDHSSLIITIFVNNGCSNCSLTAPMPNSIHQHDIHLQLKFRFQVGILSFGALAGCEKGYPSGQVYMYFFYIYLSGRVVL